eukprot:TRINITY_DN6640_c0_g1_i1.p1 TRINITY_DN6640_c0_g1~~TRINITY_DN6640_c0_g1_i1.p1  ORF type:complete len:439 (-),score=59.87 TRINITY_DN6640_c0_g1_i1:3-1319(-)
MQLEKFDLELKDNDKGRGVYAVNGFDVGRTVLVDHPVASTVKKEYVRKCCENCFLVGLERYKVCSRCKRMFYCGRDCQKAHWKRIHKSECDAIVSVLPNVPTESMLLATRILHGEHSIRMDEFVNNRDVFGSKELDDLVQMSRLIQDFRTELKEIDLNVILNLLCILKCNVFNIHDNEMRNIGVGLYPNACLINHSCNPNTVPCFEGEKVVLRAIRPISEGEEITVTYVEIGASRQDRQTELKENFYFECSCTTCQDFERDIIMNQLKCNSCSSILPDNLFCSTCEKDLSDYISLRLLFFKDSLKENNQDESVFQDCLQIADETLGDKHILRFQLYDKYSDYLIEHSDWKRAQTFLLKTVELAEDILPKKWPILGVLYLKLAKLESFLLYDELSIDHYRKAISILEVTSGKKSLLVSEAEQQIAQLQMELMYNPRQIK